MPSALPRFLRSLVWFWLPLLLPIHAGCAGTSSPPAPTDPTYTLVLLKTGPRTEPLSPDERAKVFGGHFANMERLSREGLLLLAGRFGKNKSDGALRGIFVLDTGDPARAKELAESDPGFVAQVFRFELTPFTTNAALRAQRVADLAAVDAIVATGRTPEPGEGGRGYVWLRAPSADAVAAALAGNPAVLLSARATDGRALVLLDYPDVATAATMLAPLAPRLGMFVLDEWFGSGLLVDLPKR